MEADLQVREMEGNKKGKGKGKMGGNAEESTVQRLEEQLQIVKDREMKTIEMLREEMNRIKDTERLKVEKMEMEMEKMKENLEVFRVLATRRMEELERLEDVYV